MRVIKLVWMLQCGNLITLSVFVIHIQKSFNYLGIRNDIENTVFNRKNISQNNKSGHSVQNFTSMNIVVIINMFKNSTLYHCPVLLMQ